MTWVLVLFGILVLLGFLKPGRMGSTHVAVVVASGIVLGYAFAGFGH
jgi:hypothetical protein